jgi:hypothetical protein
MKKSKELDDYLNEINDVMWQHFMIKPEYRAMTDKEATDKIMDVLNKWCN